MLSRRVSVYSLLLSASCSLAAAQAVLGCSVRAVRYSRQLAHEPCAQAVMGKKRRAFDDDADESEEDEISRHAEAAWLARRRAQQPAPPARRLPSRLEVPGTGRRARASRRRRSARSRRRRPPKPQSRKPSRSGARARASAPPPPPRASARPRPSRPRRRRREGDGARRHQEQKAAGGRVQRQSEKHGEVAAGARRTARTPAAVREAGGRSYPRAIEQARAGQMMQGTREATSVFIVCQSGP